MNTKRTNSARSMILGMAVMLAIADLPACFGQQEENGASPMSVQTEAANDITFSQDPQPNAPDSGDQPEYWIKSAKQLFKAAFYTRFDYLQWNTRNNGVTLNSDNGTLYNLGYLLSKDAERLRIELFAGTVPHNDLYNDQPIHTSAEHMGGRVEYEYLWDIHCEDLPPFTLIGGIGTRAWNRSINNGFNPPNEIVSFYSQTWWTIYPYFGFEKHWLRDNGNDFYMSGRFGVTAFNYVFSPEQSSEVPAFYPQANMTGQFELGWRRNHFFIAASFEAMTWQKSFLVHYHGDPSSDMYYLPSTQMYTTGLKLGLTY